MWRWLSHISLTPALDPCAGRPSRYQFVDVSVWTEPYSRLRLALAWIFNLGLLTCLLLTVFSYYLTRQDDIHFGNFFGTFAIIVILQPFGSQVRLRNH